MGWKQAEIYRFEYYSPIDNKVRAKTIARKSAMTELMLKCNFYLLGFGFAIAFRRQKGSLHTEIGRNWKEKKSRMLMQLKAWTEDCFC